MGGVDREASEEMTLELRPEELERSFIIWRDTGKGKSGHKACGGQVPWARAGQRE